MVVTLSALGRVFRTKWITALDTLCGIVNARHRVTDTTADAVRFAHLVPAGFTGRQVTLRELAATVLAGRGRLDTVEPTATVTRDGIGLTPGIATGLTAHAVARTENVSARRTGPRVFGADAVCTFRAGRGMGRAVLGCVDDARFQVAVTVVLGARLARLSTGETD